MVLRVVFSAVTATHGRELWITDGGGPGSTARLTDIAPGAAFSNPQVLGQIGNTLYFAATTAASGNELYALDAATLTVRRVLDINPGTDSSNPSFVAKVGNKLFFSADDGVHGHELWMADGSSVVRSGVELNDEGSSAPGVAGILNGRLVLAATDEDIGRELYSVSTSGGAFTLVKDIKVNTFAPISSNPGEIAGFTKLGNQLLFDANDGTGPTLWATNGSSATQLSTAVELPQNLFVFGDKVLFNGTNAALKQQLWITDGTAGGTKLLSTVENPSNFVLYRNKVYFQGSDSHGRELWVTDGTTNGTKLLADLSWGSTSSTPYGLTVINDRLVFSADAGSGWVLWASDGTDPGTRIISHVADPNNFVPLGTKLLFNGATGTTGYELWETDGTQAGTRRLVDINPDSASSHPVLQGYFDIPNPNVPTAGNDTLTGNDSNNTIDGLAGNDIINGGKGDDTLIGGTGNDRLTGGLGNDTFVIDAAGDLVIEAAGQGTDTVRSSANHTLTANVENLALTGTAALNGAGNALANVMTGNNGNNILKGGAGNDRLNGGGGNDMLTGDAGDDIMTGGLGNDIYDADAAGDVVVEVAGQGTDTVRSSTNRGLAANIENLTLTGNAALNGTGNTLANVMTGNNGANILKGGAGNDTLNGGVGNDTMNGEAGADIMTGGAGNDIFHVDNAGDKTVEAAGGGTDTVLTTASYTLGTGQQIETFSAASVALTTAINLTGNALGQRINGNNGNNVIYGGAGNDLLVGYGGNDSIEGQAGADTLKGVSGIDKFVFRQAGLATAGTDHISDFGADDFVYFDVASGATGALAPSAFRAGANALDASDRFIYYAPSHALYFDPDGNGAAAKILFAVFDNGFAPTAADIVLF